jgi:hypothetical protein
VNLSDDDAKTHPRALDVYAAARWFNELVQVAREGGYHVRVDLPESGPPISVTVSRQYLVTIPDLSHTGR